MTRYKRKKPTQKLIRYLTQIFLRLNRSFHLLHLGHKRPHNPNLSLSFQRHPSSSLHRRLKQLLPITPSVICNSSHKLFLITEVDVHLQNIAQELTGIELVFLWVLHPQLAALGPNERIEIVIQHSWE